MATNERIIPIENLTKNLEYENPAPNSEFPIVGTGIKFSYDKLENESKENQLKSINENFNNKLDEIKDCYINIGAWGAVDSAFIKEFLSLAKEKGVNLMFNNAMYYNTSIVSVDILNDTCSFSCFSLQDEPSYDEITEERNLVLEDQLLNANSGNKIKSNEIPLIDKYYVLLSKGLKKIIYINLLGTPVTKVLPTKDSGYEALRNYVKAFQDNFKPSLFSYDYYPITEWSTLLYEGININETQNKIEGEIDPHTENFYKAFEIFSEISSKAERPFWAYCDSMSYMHLNYRVYRPVATENFLRYEAFSAIAYGAKGIVYWTFNMRDNGIDKDTEEPVEAYFSALMDRKGRRTASYYYAKKINGEIKKYQHIFLNAKEHNVFTIPLNNSNIALGGRLMVFSSSDQENGILVAEYKFEEDSYVMIVSKNVLKYDTFRISILSGELRELTPLKSNSAPDFKYYSSISIMRNLIPGGYRLFHWREK